MQLVDDDAARDGGASFALLARVLEHLAQQAHAVRERAAVVVVAQVRPRREEVLERREVVRGVDVDEVVARGERTPNRSAMTAAQVGDVLVRHRARLDRRVLLHRQVRRPGGRDAAVEVRGRHPVVDELDPRERVVRVHLVDEALVHRDVGVVPQPALDVAAGVGVGMEVDLLRADDRPAAFRLDAAHHRVRRRVAVAHAVAVRHLEEAVARGHRPEREPVRRARRSEDLSRFGKRLRAMISRMMSLVPSQISSSFASRSHFWTGESRT